MIETNTATPRQHKLFWQSSYDRGLDILLFMWPDILEKYPNAELHITYGWNLFDVMARTNPERRQWKSSVEAMMQQKGVHHYGRVGARDLKEIRKNCGIWAYPTYFEEINCISALEAQREGVVPVTVDLAALKETVQSGIIVEGKIKDIKVQQEFTKKLIDLMGDKKTWKEESKKAQEVARNYSWHKIGKEWFDVFEEPNREPLLSVITLTIREGFWNIMADNLASQSYKNFEWIILDDYPEDRTEIAKKYAEKYNLKIKYIRGDKVLGEYKRKYGLVRANNKAWQNAEGDLCVFVQDFILIPETGLEDLATIFNHNPNALIAPTDMRYNAIEPNRSNKEDWYDGEVNVLTEKDWVNQRNLNLGLRQTEEPLEFEMNYGAIPTHILKDLNGWYEFFDEAFGFDNTEIAYRALQKGYKILLDDANVGVAINLWPHIAGEDQNVAGREKNLALPQYAWFHKQVELGKLPIVRNSLIDDEIKLTFQVPDDVTNETASEWIRANVMQIIAKWEAQK